MGRVRRVAQGVDDQQIEAMQPRPARLGHPAYVGHVGGGAEAEAQGRLAAVLDGQGCNRDRPALPLQDEAVTLGQVA